MKKQEFITQYWPHQDPFADLQSIEAITTLPHSWHYDRAFLEGIYQRFKSPNLILEVGSWLGNSAIQACRYYTQEMKAKDFTLICVDTWLGSDDHWLEPQMAEHLALQHGYPSLYPQFLAHAVGAQCQEYILPLPQTSLQAARILGKLALDGAFDWVYLDGSHEPGDVLLDLMHYWPLVRRGGILMGDDWNWPGVRQSVEDYALLLRQKGFEVSLSYSYHSWALAKA